MNYTGSFFTPWTATEKVQTLDLDEIDYNNVVFISAGITYTLIYGF